MASGLHTPSCIVCGEPGQHPDELCPACALRLQRGVVIIPVKGFDSAAPRIGPRTFIWYTEETARRVFAGAPALRHDAGVPPRAHGGRGHRMAGAAARGLRRP